MHFRYKEIEREVGTNDWGRLSWADLSHEAGCRGQGVKAPGLWVLETAIELDLPLDNHQDLGPVPLEAPLGAIAKEDKS